MSEDDQADVFHIPITREKRNDGGDDYVDKIARRDKYVYTLRQNGILVGGHQLTQWRNSAEDIHRRIVGDEVYEAKLQRQFQVSGLLDKAGTGPYDVARSYLYVRMLAGRRQFQCLKLLAEYSCCNYTDIKPQIWTGL